MHIEEKIGKHKIFKQNKLKSYETNLKKNPLEIFSKVIHRVYRVSDMIPIIQTAQHDHNLKNYEYNVNISVLIIIND